MDTHRVVSHEEWLKARTEFLAKEKEFTRLRDELSQARRNLPWERVTKSYEFAAPQGKQTLAQLFDGRHQLIAYHFMLGPGWTDPCKSCSFWADNYNNIPIHLAHRDVTLIAISRAPLPEIEAVRKRMGWTFKWVSSFGSDFNLDYDASFTPEDLASGQGTHNYRPRTTTMSEVAGLTVFYKDDDGSLYHTYSTYSRGLDMLNGAYHHLDLVPKGRDEGGLPATMAWLRHHDRYET